MKNVYTWSMPGLYTRVELSRHYKVCWSFIQTLFSTKLNMPRQIVFPRNYPLSGRYFCPCWLVTSFSNYFLNACDYWHVYSHITDTYRYMARCIYLWSIDCSQLVKFLCPVIQFCLPTEYILYIIMSLMKKLIFLYDT